MPCADAPRWAAEGAYHAAVTQDLLRMLGSSAREARHVAGPWPRVAVFERIRFLPDIENLQSIRWSSRPTFRQVISFG